MKKTHKSIIMIILFLLLIFNLRDNQKLSNAIQFSGIGVSSSGWQTHIPFDTEIATKPFIQNITSTIDNTTLETTNILWQIIDHQGNIHLSWNETDYFYRNFFEENVLQYNVTVWINQSIPFNVNVQFFILIGQLIHLNGTLIIPTEESQILSISTLTLVLLFSLILTYTAVKRRKRNKRT